MKTERDALIAWLDRVDLPYLTEVQEWRKVEWVAGVRTETSIEGCTFITLGPDIREPSTKARKDGDNGVMHPGDESKVDGYGYFIHRFVFRPDGRLLESSTWE